MAGRPKVGFERVGIMLLPHMTVNRGLSGTRWPNRVQSSQEIYFLLCRATDDDLAAGSAFLIL